MPWYNKWMPIRKRIIEENNVKDHNSIFIQSNGEKIRAIDIKEWAKNWEEFFGCKILPQTFRYYYANYLEKIGLNKEEINQVTNWNSTDKVVIFGSK